LHLPQTKPNLTAKLNRKGVIRLFALRIQGRDRDMPTLGLIGYGAMAGYVARNLPAGWQVSHVIVREGREDAARAVLGDCTLLHGFDAGHAPDLMVDCAGHAGLVAHGPTILTAGVPVLTASLGALADDDVRRGLTQAAERGQTQLHLASGAIGALDALMAAAQGGLENVTYVGRKPPAGWRGTPAEDAGDLDALSGPLEHFNGSARDAARRYPRNANVAAAVAIAGLGFDATQVTLIADPCATGNSHSITAQGAFGHFAFDITGHALPDNPRTSALAAMSMLTGIARHSARIVL